MGAVNNDGFLEVTVSFFKEIITINGLSGEFEEMYCEINRHTIGLDLHK